MKDAIEEHNFRLPYKLLIEREIFRHHRMCSRWMDYSFKVGFNSKFNGNWLNTNTNMYPFYEAIV